MTDPLPPPSDSAGPALPGACRRAREALPALAVGEDLPSGWRGRRLRRHLARCADCAAEQERQRRVAAGLAEVAASPLPEEPVTEPPEGLLDSLLEHAAQPGVRGRVAVPMRGAVSGARPRLTIALVGVALVAGAAAGWATWRLGRMLTRCRRGR